MRNAREIMATLRFVWEMLLVLVIFIRVDWVFAVFALVVFIRIEMQTYLLKLKNEKK